ncbi:MAG: polymer-forming cytoskeletal protein [Alphaproteobacteria bacterium]
MENREKPKIPSILSEGIRIHGDIRTEGDIQLDGVIDGDIATATLTVGAAAVVNGGITGETIRISGTVNGTITAATVELTATARVTGDIFHESLSVEAGAHIEGLCKHTSPEQPRRDAGSRPSLVVTDDPEGEATAS